MYDGSPLPVTIAEEAHDQIVHGYRGGDQIVPAYRRFAPFLRSVRRSKVVSM
jgi:hypothetical protein